MPNPVVHFEIAAKDPKKSHEFYSKLFGWHVDANNPMNYGIVDTHTEGVGIGGGIAGPAPAGAPPHPGVTVYVSVEDLEKTLKEAEAMGGKTLVPPTVIPDMVTFALFSDPAGNAIGIIKGD